MDERDKYEPSEAVVASLCDQLDEVLVGRRGALSMIDAICETGADPRALRVAFSRMAALGRATLVGGDHRGWNLLRRAQS